MRVGLYLSTLYGLYGLSGCVGSPGHEIHELVDDVAVKPCQWSRDAAEDDFLGHEHIATSDGSHPTDLGFTYMLDSISPKILKILRKYGIK